MDDAQRNLLRAHIQERMAQLTAQMPIFREASQPVAPDNALGRLTRLDAIQSKEMNDANMRQAEADLTALAQALTRLDHPEFGLCEICETQIPLGRLKALPATRVCVQCADQL